MERIGKILRHPQRVSLVIVLLLYSQQLFSVPHTPLIQNGQALNLYIERYQNVKIANPLLIATLREIAFSYNVPSSIAIAVALYESQLQADCLNYNKNGTKDIGLYQLNSEYIPYFLWKLQYPFSKTFNPYNPVHSASIGIGYLAYLYKQFGTWELALMAYNGGPTRVKSGNISIVLRKYASTVLYLANCINAQIF
ncbi:MAG TPA: transglycosylase SLT domain-containing protein [Methanofastidiosum sp.]|nr:transglycosylase SLT domain-containing protein [Methanofastidiosum sp.]